MESHYNATPAYVRFRPIADIRITCEVHLVTTNRTPFTSLVVMVVIAGVVGCSTASIPSSDNKEMIDWNGSKAQAEDAMRRWAPKADESLGMVRKGWSPSLMAFPTKNCIQLSPNGVGGAPIYCYRANSLELVEEYSDVE